MRSLCIPPHPSFFILCLSDFLTSTTSSEQQQGQSRVPAPPGDLQRSPAGGLGLGACWAPEGPAPSELHRMLVGEEDSSGLRVGDDVQVEDLWRGGRTRKCCCVSGDSVSNTTLLPGKHEGETARSVAKNLNIVIAGAVCPQGAQVHPVGPRDAEAGGRPGRFQDSRLVHRRCRSVSSFPSPPSTRLPTPLRHASLNPHPPHPRGRPLLATAVRQRVLPPGRSASLHDAASHQRAVQYAGT